MVFFIIIQFEHMLSRNPFDDTPSGATGRLKWTPCIIHDLLKRPCSALELCRFLSLYTHKLERHPKWTLFLQVFLYIAEFISK